MAQLNVIDEAYSMGYGQGNYELPLEFDLYSKDDYIKTIEFFYGMYCSNNCGIGYNGYHFGSKRYISELRSYGAGEQPISKYRNVLDPVDSSGMRKMNISWDTVKIFQKFRDIIKDKVGGLYLDLTTKASNNLASYRRQTMENKLRLLMSEEGKQLAKSLPFPLEGQEQAGQFGSLEELELFKLLGGVRLQEEILMKDGLQSTLANSGWETIKDMLIEDLIDILGFATDVQKVNGRLVMKYVDIAKVIIGPSIYPDYRDTSFRGYLEYKNISEIRQENPDISEEDLKSIHLSSNKYFEGSTGVGSTGYGFREDFVRPLAGNDSSHYREFGSPVVTMYWVDKAVRSFITGYHSRGSRRFQEVQPDFTLSKRMIKEGLKLEHYPIQYIFKGSWVPGTNFLYNWGVADTIVREGSPGNKKAIHSMNIYMAHQTPSITARCIPSIDDVNLASYKIRSAITKMAPGPRMAINMQKLEDSVDIGNKSYTMLDLLGRYQTTGILLYRTLQEYGVPGYENDTSKVIDFLPSGIQEDIAILRSEILSGIEIMRQVTGINMITDGTSASPDMLKSVMAGLAGSTNSALKPHVLTFVQGYKNMMKYVMLRWRIAALTGETLIADIGGVSMGQAQEIFQDRALGGFDWNLDVEVITSEQREMLLATLMSKKDALPQEAFFLIFNLIHEGDYKKAQLFLSIYVSRALKAEREYNMKLAQMNAQANMQAAQVAEGLKAKNTQMEYNLKDAIAAQADLRDEIKSQSDLEREKELTLVKDASGQKREVAVVRANNQNRLET